MCSPDPPQLPQSTQAHRLAQLEQEICELAGHLAAATCRWLLLIAEFDARGGWAEWGAAFRTGQLSYCKVRAITRVAAPETEEHLVDLGLHATGAQLEKVVRLFRGALKASTESACELHARRELTHVWNDDGSLTIEARLPPEEGALVLAALKAAEADSSQAEDVSAETSASPEPPATRRADALVSIARSCLAGGETVRSDGEPCEVSVHVDVGSLADESIHDRCELTDGPAIAPETARRLCCDGSIVRIIERDGRPLSVGRRRRTVPAPLRRALRSRDDGCRFPGCTHKRFLHAHHIHHWARGGPTELDNLIQLCSHHHRLVHEGGFGVERAGKRGVRFRRPDGCLIPDASPQTRPRGPDLQGQHRGRGLAIDAETCMPRSIGDPIDYDLTIMGLCDEALDDT